jgi:IS30 family transposase
MRFDRAQAKKKPLVQHVGAVTDANGKEFADHAVVNEIMQSTAYFADPLTS